MTRLANMCPCISHLQLSAMSKLSEAGRLSLARLFIQIIQENPPIKILNMQGFSACYDRKNFGEIILEALLSANINSITDLNIRANRSWFKHPDTRQERSDNVTLLAYLIIKHADLQHIDLGANYFSSISTKQILTKISGNPSTRSKIQTLKLSRFNLEAYETVLKLADILQLAKNLKEIDIKGQTGNR